MKYNYKCTFCLCMFTIDEVESFHCKMCVAEGVNEDIDCVCRMCVKKYRQKNSISKVNFTKKLLNTHYERFHGAVDLV